MSAVVTLSQWIGVGGCGWMSSSKVIKKTPPAFTFMNNETNYASAADNVMNSSMVQRE